MNLYLLYCGAMKFRLGFRKEHSMSRKVPSNTTKHQCNPGFVRLILLQLRSLQLLALHSRHSTCHLSASTSRCAQKMTQAGNVPASRSSPKLWHGLRLCQLAAVRNDHRLGGLARLRADSLNLLHNIHAVSHSAKHHMLAIQPLSLHRAKEELRSIRVGSSVGHGQNSRSAVLEGEVLICKLGAVDGFAASAVAGREVSSLCKKYTKSNMFCWGT